MGSVSGAASSDGASLTPTIAIIPPTDTAAAEETGEETGEEPPAPVIPARR